MGSRRSRAFRVVRTAGIFMAALGLLVAGFFALRQRGKAAAPSVPTADVVRGEFVDYLQVRGEVQARVSTMVTAPFNAGDLQIIKLCRDGELVGKGEVAVQFDTVPMQRTVEQNRSALKEAEAEIDRLKAQLRIRAEQSATDMMKVMYDIERARLELGKEAVLPAIEVEKARLGVARAEQRRREFEARAEADKVAAEADLAAAEQKRAKAQSDLSQAERNVAALTLTAPISGIATLMPNYRARAGFGLNAPSFKEGDRAWPGAGIVEFPNLSTIQVTARLDESERGRLRLGQTVSLRVDALPDREHKGVVSAISALARLDYSGWPVRKNFDLTVQLEQLDPRLRPGMSATARIAVERLQGSILVPAAAVFDKGGRTVCYVQSRERFEERLVQVSRRSEEQVAVMTGLSPGLRVALSDPTGQSGGK